MHRDRLTVAPLLRRLYPRAAAAAVLPRAAAAAAASAAALLLAACGNTYRPVVSAINPVGPAGQPQKYAEVISSNGTSAQGLSTLIDVSGDTIVNTTLIGVNPKYLLLAIGGGEAYTLNGDGTLTSFAVSPSLLASQVLQSTLFPNSNPVSISTQGNYLYIPEVGRNATAVLNSNPPAIVQELPSGTNPVYTIASNGAPRVYTLVQGNGVSNGIALPIESSSNTTDAPLAVGVQPVYGVMTGDARRAFVMNKGSNNVTVINAQSNALDTFTVNGAVTSTIPVGVAPVWADFAPTLNELVVLNQGNSGTVCPDGSTTGCGSVTIVNIPICNSNTLTTNPNCDPANPVDAVGFGTVLANIPVGVNPVMVAVLQDGTEAFVANAGNPGLPCALPAAGKTPNCSVSVINLQTNAVTATVPFIASTNENDSYGHGHPNWIAVTTGTPTGKAYITAGDSTDITILRSDLNTLETHLPLQGNGVAVRLTNP